MVKAGEEKQRGKTSARSGAVSGKRKRKVPAHDVFTAVEKLAASNKKSYSTTDKLQMILALQQSSIFNDKQHALQANYNNAKWLLQKHAMGELDANTLRSYNDTLCHDMASGATLSKMQSVNGTLDDRCICGTPRQPTDRRVRLNANGVYTSVSNASTNSTATTVGERKKSSTTHDHSIVIICSTCGRMSNSYTRFCIDGQKARRELKMTFLPPDKQRALVKKPPSSSEELSASQDSMDVYVTSLCNEFERDTIAPKTVQLKQAPRGRQRRSQQNSRVRKCKQDLFDSQNQQEYQSSGANKIGKANAEAVSVLQYNGRVVHTKHASLTNLQIPANDKKLVEAMFVR